RKATPRYTRSQIAKSIVATSVSAHPSADHDQHSVAALRGIFVVLGELLEVEDQVVEGVLLLFPELGIDPGVRHELRVVARPDRPRRVLGDRSRRLLPLAG